MKNHTRGHRKGGSPGFRTPSMFKSQARQNMLRSSNLLDKKYRKG